MYGFRNLRFGSFGLIVFILFFVIRFQSLKTLFLFAVAFRVHDLVLGFFFFFCVWIEISVVDFVVK